MSPLLEDPLLVAMLGLVPVAIAAIYFFQTRSRRALVIAGALVLLTVAAVVYERWYVTPTEAVRATVGALFDQIEANDLPGVLQLLDPSAKSLRSDAEVLMPMFQVMRATTGGEVAVELGPDSSVATARLKPLLRVQHRTSGAMGAYFDRLRIDLERHDQQWLVTGYEAAQDWRQGAAQLDR